MKNTKIFISAVGIPIIICSALAFKAKTLVHGNVWCFTSIPVSSRACSADPGGTNISFYAVITGGSKLNPCTSASPYISTQDNCETPAVGQEYLSTGE
jgi:hypothetical protein